MCCFRKRHLKVNEKALPGSLSRGFEIDDAAERSWHLLDWEIKSMTAVNIKSHVIQFETDLNSVFVFAKSVFFVPKVLEAVFLIKSLGPVRGSCHHRPIKVSRQTIIPNENIWLFDYRFGAIKQSID